MRFGKTLAMTALALVVWAGEAQAQVRLTDDQARAAAVIKVTPEYPAMARQMRLSGRVELDATIDSEGNVEKVQVITGNPLLSSAAVAALKKWKFNPFSDGGKPVQAVARIAFDFKL